MRRPTNTEAEPFFVEPIDQRQAVRTMASDVICRLLIWMADGRTLEDRGLRACIALYCIRPDLIDGATGAAQNSYQAIGPAAPDLAILISCVGRKLVLKQRIEEEVEAVRETLGAHATLAGFYSYGEISPFTPGAKCELHNQTMTITVLSET